MTSDVQVFGKDKIKLNILHDVLSGMVKIGFQLNQGNEVDYASQIHEEGKRVYVIGKFNLSEDPSDGDTITIRPIMIDTPLKILFHANAHFSGKKASIVRNATKSIEQEFEISSETVSIELCPQGKQFYLMKVSNGGGIVSAPIQSVEHNSPKRTTITNEVNTVPAITQNQAGRFEDISAPRVNHSIESQFQGFEIGSGSNIDNRFESFEAEPGAIVSRGNQYSGSNPSSTDQGMNQFITPIHTGVSDSQHQDKDLNQIEQEISVIERQQSQLSRKKQSAIEHLEKIEEEYKKDYASLEQELEDYKSRMDADASIIEHYKNQDVMPIEIIFQEIRLKLDEAEEQIRFFIEAKQRKTMEIENEIKSNKKQ